MSSTVGKLCAATVVGGLTLAVALILALAAALAPGAGSALADVAEDDAGGCDAGQVRREGECGGKRVFHKRIDTKSSGKPIGYLNVYYDRTTGKLCAKTASSSKTRGTKKYMYISLSGCKSGRVGDSCRPTRPVQEGGSSRYNAGPVRVSARNYCIRAVGKIRFEGKTSGASTSMKDPHHC